MPKADIHRLICQALPFWQLSIVDPVRLAAKNNRMTAGHSP